MSTEVTEIATAKVKAVKPLEFDITITISSTAEASAWIDDLKARHTCIHKIVWMNEWGTFTFRQIFDFTIVLDEDADYQQLCALRAELKA